MISTSAEFLCYGAVQLLSFFHRSFFLFLLCCCLFTVIFPIFRQTDLASNAEPDKIVPLSLLSTSSAVRPSWQGCNVSFSQHFFLKKIVKFIFCIVDAMWDQMNEVETTVNQLIFRAINFHNFVIIVILLQNSTMQGQSATFRTFLQRFSFASCSFSQIKLLVKFS